MSRQNAVCLAVVLLTPLAAAAIASIFSLAVGNLFPVLPAVVAAVIVNAAALQFASVPRRYREAADFGAMACAIGGTFGYTVITVLVAQRL